MISSPERKFQRAPCSFPGTYAWVGKTSPAEIVSLSIGGAYFACSNHPPSGSNISFAIRLSDYCLIRGRGKVVWNAKKKKPDSGGLGKLPLGFGVEFEEMRLEDREVIDIFVRRKLRVLRSIAYEIRQSPRDGEKVKSLFSEIHPNESSHLNHIKKVVREELRFFRIRK